jgi:hypothetical protein
VLRSRTSGGFGAHSAAGAAGWATGRAGWGIRPAGMRIRPPGWALGRPGGPSAAGMVDWAVGRRLGTRAAWALGGRIPARWRRTPATFRGGRPHLRGAPAKWGSGHRPRRTRGTRRRPHRGPPNPARWGASPPHSARADPICVVHQRNGVRAPAKCDQLPPMRSAPHPKAIGAPANAIGAPPKAIGAPAKCDPWPSHMAVRTTRPRDQRLPRASCSRSIASNSALKLPFPKPSEPCRSMNS